MSTPNIFLLPDLGEGLAEAELVTWFVSVGDRITVDQPIAEVETAKSVVEVPSPYAGTVAVLHGEPGEVMDVGKPLISVMPADSSPVSVPVQVAAAGRPVDASVHAHGGITRPVAPAPDAAAAAYREEERAGSGNVLIGYGTPAGQGHAGRRRTRKLSHPAGPQHVQSPPHTRASPPTTPAPPGATAHEVLPGRGERLAVSSPLVRRLAYDSGVDLHAVHGTGAAGLITRRDVEAALSAGAAVSPLPSGIPRTAGLSEAQQSVPVRDSPAGSPPGISASTSAGADDSEVDPRTGLVVASRTPVRGVRKAVAAAMTRSRTEIPEATVWVDVDATALVGLRSAMKERSPEDTPGLLAFIARFVTSGLRKYPELNSRFQPVQDAGAGASTTDGAQILGFGGVNLGFAAQTDRGLVVPSIRRADRLSARGLDAEIRRLGRVAREGKASPTELTGSTFTINNYGVFGVDGSAAIINHPEAAMLGIGRIIDRAWVVDGELAIRKIVELTLVFDHRVCDGGAASAFLRHVVDAIEDPASALADL
ncbi:branched-chain alpha-keto acid dehydrogenase subunit E2 [Arthrobacter sp. RIT-PI-e]|uniref:dihydrolipoamide acetyltransferase family protein n=1 Tax=Arthrobacter sp. RIT-PI-e TaxID=1681197 RepID=UPI000676603F|nr:dihydrolipoamide acetyltransferase family protein [Arthrobacter sp. RIT-PI-e]KNC17862.1 branched-chain alpha-keto acid dehydrogenase subunit E2 [Arthrobacter sp. RIT-PI-e]